MADLTRELYRPPHRTVMSSGLILACCTAVITLLTALHLYHWDSNWQTENVLLILVVTIVAAWTCNPSLTLALTFVTTIVWCVADFRRDSIGWVYLFMYSMRVAATLFLVVYSKKVRRDLEQARQLARVDALTGLPNRKAILEMLESELSRVRRLERSFSIALLDCDGFKTINDQQGHLAGDRALQNLAHALRKHTRPYDGVGRLGGDEFVLILSEADSDQIPAIIDRLRIALHDELGSEYPSLTFSIGVTTVRPPLDQSRPMLNWHEYLNHADQAMYSAKRSGRDQTRFSA